MILKRKYSFRQGFEPPIHGLRNELSTTELSDFLMNGDKGSPSGADHGHQRGRSPSNEGVRGSVSSLKLFVYKSESVKYTQ